MMILLNSQPTAIPENCDLLTLLEATFSACFSTFCAVAVNRRFVARARYSQTTLRENDQVDIVVPMQGG